MGSPETFLLTVVSEVPGALSFFLAPMSLCCELTPELRPVAQRLHGTSLGVPKTSSSGERLA